MLVPGNPERFISGKATCRTQAEIPRGWPKPQAFTPGGFVLVSVNYRLLPKATIKQMAGDVANTAATPTRCSSWAIPPGRNWLPWFARMAAT
jgi:hypothetical protein